MPDSISNPPRPLIAQMLDQLRRHPKRVVFTDGEDARVLEAAARLVAAEAVAPVLLGDRDRIRALAADTGISLKFVHVIDPPKSADFQLFCQRVENMARYRSMVAADPAEIVSRPQYFGALMTQYGQADAVVGGNLSGPGTYFRALIQTIKPEAGVPRIFTTSLVFGPEDRPFGAGMAMFADCGMIPVPGVEELAAIAVETGKLARHLLGRPPLVAMLSHSTRGSSGAEDARRMAAATALARSRAGEEFLDMRIEGEIQADVAVNPVAAARKIPGGSYSTPADVLVFPSLDAADIAIKLLCHGLGMRLYGQIVMGLARPAAYISRTADAETLFGTAAVVAVEAIKYHLLHPESDY